MQYTLTISVDTQSNSIVIVDGNGDPGGDVIANTGDGVTWINATNRTCMLSFRELKLGGRRYGPRVWPFKEADPGGDLPIPPVGSGGTIDRGKLPGGKTTFYVKYDIQLTGGGPPLTLDPMIIIER
jgi:hypothetical protein